MCNKGGWIYAQVLSVQHGGFEKWTTIKCKNERDIVILKCCMFIPRILRIYATIQW